MTQHTYNCSQQHLYTIARMAWHSCNKYLTAFTEFSPKYTPSYISNATTQIHNAELLSSQEKATQLLYAQLIQQSKTSLRLWQKLKLYIIEAYPESEQQIQLNTAGHQHYRQASRKYWTHCTQLLNNANTYIANHQAQLQANGNMPATFPDTFHIEKEKYITLLDQYRTSSISNPVNTQQKIITNNNIHKQLMTMLLDGQRIFNNNPALKKLFTFDQLHFMLIAHRRDTTE